MDSRRIVVSGRVQGVGYRYYILEKASELNLNGFVRNLPNGTVEIEVEGENSLIDILTDYCRIGPARAIVDRITTTSQPVVGYKHFSVR